MHPYQVIKGTILDNGTGTNISFNANRPTSGVVTWLSDYLHITTNMATEIFVNTSTGTNLINFTSNPGFVDMTAFNEANITVWANSTMNVHRVSEFRQTDIFFWTYDAEQLKFTTGETISNGNDLNWRNVVWFLGFGIDEDGVILPSDSGSVLIYDVDNMVQMRLGDNFDLTDAGIEMGFSWLNASISRQFQFTYWLNNASSIQQSTPIINIRQYTIETTPNGIANRYSGRGMWINNRTASYTGDIAISLKSLEGTIDPSSVIVYDNVRNLEIFDEYYTISGSTITINSDGTGVVGPKESRDYTVYFTYSESQAGEFFLFESNWRVAWVNLNAHLLILMGAFASAGYGTVQMITARRQKEDAQGFGYILIGTFLFLVYIALWIWHSMGLL